MTHSIHPDAEAELGDAAVYYATHASHAIAEAFLAEYERVRDLIIQNQNAARKSLPSRTRAASQATGATAPD